MAGKNKGGREVRKPKVAKKAKDDSTSIVTKMDSPKKAK
ncbi:MAG: hypothetical protein JWN95_2275 [Frankiales bacterium]|nr:hypothetical protein [Frankiales bacterium]